MSKGNAALAFAAGFGQGYLGARERAERKKLDDEERAARKEDREYLRSERERVASDRMALANAAKPATVSEAGALPDGLQYGSNEDAEAGTSMPAVPRFRVETGQGAQRFDTPEQADAAAARHNDPAAMAGRVSLALAQQGKPVEAMEFQGKAEEFAQKRWTSQIREAISRGHEGLADMVSRSEGGQLGGIKVKAVPSPDGKQVTYHKVNPDGSETPVPHLTFTNDQEGIIRAGYMLDRSVTPETRYKNMVAEDKQAAAVAAKEKELELRKRQLEEVQIPNAETRAQLAQVQAQLAEIRAANAGRKGGDGVSREERLRYTTLFTDAGRRMQDSQKALNTMRGDRGFMRRATQDPNSPEGRQLADVQEQLRGHQEERELYRGLLAEGKPGKGGKAAGLADAEPKNGAPAAPRATPPAGQASAPVKVTTKAERDKLPKGTRYVGPDGNTYIKQ